MKRIVLILFAICFYTYTKATVKFTPSMFSKHLFFVGAHSGNLKMMQLYKLTDEINKALFNDSAYIRVYYLTDSFYFGNSILPVKPKYCLQYSNCLFQDFAAEDKILPTTSRHKALSLYCNYWDIDIRECIKLIYYGLAYHDMIEKEQTLLLAKTELGYTKLNDIYSPNVYGEGMALSPQFDFIYSISEAQIDSILSINMPKIEPFANQKAYRRWTIMTPASLGKIDYYIQNNKYFVYRVTGKKNKWCDDCLGNWKERLKDTAGIVLFSLNYIADIIGDGEENYIISTGDSFYHYLATTNKLDGPYFLPHLDAPDWSIASFNEKLEYSNDTFTIHASMWSLGDYDIKYVWSSHYAFVDSSSIDPNLKFYLIRMKDEARVEDSIHKQKVALIKNIVQKQKSKQYQMLALASIVLFLNAFLIWRARK